MLEYSATTVINASPDTIWKILVDGAGYPSWDPGTIKIEGTIAQGEKILAYSKLSPNRAFPVKVSEFVPNQSMTWEGGMPLGLFRGVRTFKLLPKGSGQVEFQMREQFSGPMLFLIGRTIPDMTETFRVFAEGLKKRAEGR